MSNPNPTPSTFYDDLAPYYHLLYGDWERSVQHQGDALACLLNKHGIGIGEPVLDAACGIGTQTIGLIQRGYFVTASDISAGAVDRLKKELASRSMQANVHVDDLRDLSHTPPESMSAVLACDNSIPHLLSDQELLQSFTSCFRCLRPGGLAVFSVRDYATTPRVNPDIRPYGIHRQGATRFLAVQVWEWEGDQYDLRIYLTSESENGICSTRVLQSRYYAVSIDKLITLLSGAGFVDVQRLDDVLFQPVIIARRPNAT